MVYFLYGIFFISCLLLIAAVLLQPGKTDAGALFTSNVSSSAFAPRGTATVLSKVTIAAAVTFMLSALMLSMPALTGNVSVLSSNPDDPSVTETNANTPDSNTVPVASESNANASDPAANIAPDNSNGALIETPATEAIKANANAANANAAPASNTAPVNR